MSKFYTNVFSRGNKVYVRGYENGKAFQKYEYYKPYLFVDDKDGNYKTVDKKPASKIMFNSISEAKEFVTKYKDIQNFNYYGLENFQYLYIYDNYSGDVQYDPSKMSIVSLDIECIADQGFPDIQLADKEITAITIRKNKLNLVFGCGEFITDDPNTKYFRCKDEKELLYKFVDIWNRPFIKPDIITGWNCIPINSSLWKEDEIININEVQVGDKLYDSNVIRKFPESSKPVVVQKLSNGQRIKSSKEHIFPYRLCPKDNYTKLSLGGKSYTSEEDISVENAINDAREKFLFVNTRNNINSDYLNYNLDQCYLMGLIYTDGSLKSKNNLTHGFTFYQSDFEFMKKIKEKFSIKSKIVGPYKNCYHLHIPYSLLGDISPIYKDGKKHIDKKLISKFSEKQYMSFLSGMLDGDGYISKGKISLCNFNNDIDNIYELSLWNGIFSCISENHIRFIDIDISKLSLLKEKRWGNFEESKLLRESSQKAKDIKFKKGNGGYWVRVKEIYEESDVTMIDIETDTHYFVTGGVKSHNCEFFDIPYLVNRIRNICGEDLARNLSPWRMINEGKVHYKGKENQNFILMGISTLDYYQLYRKFTFGNQESYKLDYIASVELGEKKIDYSEYGSLLELYKNNFQKFIEYNIHDVVLVDKLEEKLKFIEQVMALAYDAKVNFVDTLTTVRPWDIIIHNYLLDRKTVVPKLIIKDNNESLVGGFVKDPKVGMSEWVVSFDLNSLYPHLIMQYNISPEKFVKKIPMWHNTDELISKKPIDYEPGYIYSGNGCVYKNDYQGFLPALMEKMYNDRSEYKKKMIELKKKFEETKDAATGMQIAKYHNMQMAKKIQLNSAYGALGNKYFRWFNFDLAESITKSGQLSIRWIEKRMNEFMNKMLKTDNVDYVIASDTDSIYIEMKELVKRIDVNDDVKIVSAIDQFCEQKIQPYLDKCYQELADYMNVYQQKMFMKRETIANKGIWKAKKMYILNAWNVEGVQYDSPKLKMQGIEAVRSSTPQVCREYIRKALEIIMNESEISLQNYISQIREEYKNLPFDDIAFPRGANNVDKYYDRSNIYVKGTPIHIKASLLYNNLLKKYGLRNLQPIMSGDKIKYCYLKLPNKIQDTVISNLDSLPDELGLNQYIDYEKQFDKSFIEPLKSITSIISWDYEKKLTLEDFFNV